MDLRAHGCTTVELVIGVLVFFGFGIQTSVIDKPF